MGQQYEFAYSDLNPQFLYAYIFDRNEEEKLGQVHDFIHLVVIMKGKGKVVIDGKTTEIEEGTVFAINPGCEHRTIPDGITTECYLAFTKVQFTRDYTG